MDGAVDENAVGVVSGGLPRQDGIGSRGQDEDVVGDDVAAAAEDRLLLRVDAGDFGIEVVSESPVRYIGILVKFNHDYQPTSLHYEDAWVI